MNFEASRFGGEARALVCRQSWHLALSSTCGAALGSFILFPGVDFVGRLWPPDILLILSSSQSFHGTAVLHVFLCGLSSRFVYHREFKAFRFGGGSVNNPLVLLCDLEVGLGS
ncbi:hypothetical protein Bca52824_016756 [Brassica carinata]|uniref:Uncharacterized protein n=1 Tax=Brassica carinata TaxID=52824 RepID=A0A8X8B6Q4_BRACI|nr:hypothetical protein Bca52824_016756 [Brassica carinata]